VIPMTKITASLAAFNDTTSKGLTGHCANFKPGTFLHCWLVRYSKPTPSFHKSACIHRSGKRLCPTTGDFPNVADESTTQIRGSWTKFDDEAENPPHLPRTLPQSREENIRQCATEYSASYLDDEGDGMGKSRSPCRARADGQCPPHRFVCAPLPFSDFFFFLLLRQVSAWPWRDPETLRQ